MGGRVGAQAAAVAAGCGKGQTVDCSQPVRRSEADRGWFSMDFFACPGRVIATRCHHAARHARVHIGTAKGAKSVLHRSCRGPQRHKPARTDEPCAQLELQSTV